VIKGSVAEGNNNAAMIRKIPIFLALVISWFLLLFSKQHLIRSCCGNNYIIYFLNKFKKELL
jgi:hypothetical protein